MSGPIVRANRDPYANSVSLLVMSGGSPESTYVADPLVMRKVDPGEYIGDRPTVRLDNQAAQQLMDELWHCGLRPSEGSGSAGSLAATERHLEDMRKIAFSVIK